MPQTTHQYRSTATSDVSASNNNNSNSGHDQIGTLPRRSSMKRVPSYGSSLKEHDWDQESVRQPSTAGMGQLSIWSRILPAVTGIVTMILILYATYYRENYSVHGIPFSTASHVIGQPETFLLCLAAAFSLNMILAFVAGLLDEHTANELHRTLYDLLFHVLGGILFLAASIWTLAFENRFRLEGSVKGQLMAAGALGMLTGVLHLVHVFISYRGYRTT